VENPEFARNVQANSLQIEKIYLWKALFCVKIRYFLWKNMLEMWITLRCGKPKSSSRNPFSGNFEEKNYCANYQNQR
jgi:hypothetical protein